MNTRSLTRQTLNRLVTFVASALLFLGVSHPACAASQRVAIGANHTLVIASYGTVFASGSNSYGQLGNATPAPKTTGNPPLPSVTTLKEYSPIEVSGLTNIVAVACGDTHSLALDAQGRVWVWGRNDFGQLAKSNSAGGIAYSASPILVTNVPLPTNAQIVEIAAGANGNLVRDSLGNVYGWGANDRAQLATPPSTGTAIFTPRSIALVDAGSSTPAFAISAGSNHCLALTSKGVFAWGGNNDGQVGNGSYVTTPPDVTTPFLVPYTATVFAIAAGGNHSLALYGDGGLLAWGSNAYYQCGMSLSTSDLRTPGYTPIGTIRFRSISAGFRHSAAVAQDGAYTWGNNAQGQLGQGDTAVRKTVTHVDFN
jgi:alpha-tubulin suppressor-like RCC1 family protein